MRIATVRRGLRYSKVFVDSEIPGTTGLFAAREWVCFGDRGKG